MDLESRIPADGHRIDGTELAAAERGSKESACGVRAIGAASQPLAEPGKLGDECAGDPLVREQVAARRDLIEEGP
jgi:hypothetical protein